MMHHMYYYNGYWGNPGFNILSFIFPIIFWGLIIFLLISLFKHHETGENKQNEQSKTNSNIEIVKERYARGEINKKEYEQLKRDLG